MSDLKQARHVAFTAGKEAVLRAATKAGVEEFTRIVNDTGFTDDEEFAARTAVRGVMVRLRVYDRFCDDLDKEDAQ